MKLLVSAALLALAAPFAANAQTVPTHITAALADSGRPQAEKDRDAARHSGEIVAFAGIKPGDKVADFLMGGGFWTRILSPAVGPKGRVYAYQAAEFIQYRAEYGTEQDAAVKWMIGTAIKAAHEAKVKIGLCGQAPSNHPAFAEFLVDCGIDSLSVSPDSFVAVKRKVAAAEARVLLRATG